MGGVNVSDCRAAAVFCVGLLAAATVGGVAATAVRSIDLGVHLHALWYWQGRLHVNDWILGFTYALDHQGSPHRTSLVTRGGMCDVVVEDGVVFGMGEQEREISRFDMQRETWLQPVSLPAEVDLGGLDVHGIEKVGDTFWLLAAPAYNQPRNPSRHRIVTWEVGSNRVRQYDCFGVDPELIGLQFFNGSMWTFQYSTGLLWRVDLGEQLFRLCEPWKVTESITNCASGGFRGFLLGEDEIVLTSITYVSTETARVHFVPYPRGFRRQP